MDEEPAAVDGADGATQPQDDAVPTQELDGVPENGDGDEAGTAPADASEAHPVIDTDGPIAVFEGVSKSYGEHQAIVGIDATLEGRCVGLLGPNGAGKTTLIRMLMGLLPPSSGTLRVLGVDVAKHGKLLRRHIGYVPEGDAVFPGLSGIASVAYAGRLVGMSAADAMQRAHQVLDYVGLDDERYRLAETYSTGMRQRLKLAQALVHDPDLLILDEPTEGVDPQARDQILALINELGQEHGIRTLVSTHLLSDVERLATHALVLDGGAIATHGPVEQLQSTGASGHMVRLNDAPGEFIARLERDGIAWKSMDPDIRVAIDDPKDIMRRVREAGLVVRQLTPVRLRLDEAFERAIGGGHDA